MCVFVCACQVVKTTSALCLKAHQASTDLFEASIEQWRKDVGPGTQVILGNYNLSLTRNHPNPKQAKKTTCVFFLKSCYQR